MIILEFKCILPGFCWALFLSNTIQLNACFISIRLFAFVINLKPHVKHSSKTKDIQFIVM